MYSIFAPLDADERLPRELILEARRHKTLGRRELAGALWLPALFLIIVLISWARFSALEAIGLVSLAYGGFWGFILLGDRASN
jgi:hypothetical protein